MLEEIEIQNFRCFEDTKISGFARVNLIGGKNNSGKTALLEALYLFNAPLPQGVLFLMQLRKESLSFSKAFPEKTWDNLFFRGKKDQQLCINSKITFEIYKNVLVNFKKNTNRLLDISSSDSKDLSRKLVNFNKPNSSFLLSKINFKYINGLGLEYNYDLLKVNAQGITLENNFFIGTVKQPEDIIPWTNDAEINRNLQSKSFQVRQQLEKFFLNLENIICFLPSNHRYSSQELAIEYDQCVLNNKASEILNIIKIIDPSIEEIRTLSLGEPQIYLRRKGEDLLPISLFGDALNRIIEIVINLIDVKNGILLIDEIENGIHYLNQREFWLNLFKLSKVLNVQIFATTHSLEMIKAFADVGLKEYPEEAAYIELARHPKTNQIIGIKRDMETLDYALENEKGVGLRGE